MRIIAVTVSAGVLSMLLVPALIAQPAALDGPPAGGVAAGPRQDAESACAVSVTKTAAPAEVVLGDPVAITLTVDTSCPPLPPPRLVFVAEATGNAFDRAAAEANLRAMGGLLPPGAGLGLVVFDADGGVVCPIGDAPAAPGDCVAAAAGMTLADAMRESLALFTLARADGERWYQGLVAATDFSGTLDCPSLLAAAAELRAERVELSTLCAGPGCDGDCLGQVATTPRDYYEALDPTNLPAVAAALIGDLSHDITSRAATPLRLELTDMLPPNMAYRRGTASPEPSRSSPTRDEFTWVIDAPPGTQVTATLAVEPLDVGTYPTNREATGVLTDPLGRSRAFEFPVPAVRVAAPPPTVWSTYIPLAEAGRP